MTRYDVGHNHRIGAISKAKMKRELLKYIGGVESNTQSIEEVKSPYDIRKELFLESLAEIYGIYLPDDKYALVGDAIRRSRSIPVRRLSYRRVIHDVKISGRLVRVVYDKKHKQCILAIREDLLNRKGEL